MDLHATQELDFELIDDGDVMFAQLLSSVAAAGRVFRLHRLCNDTLVRSCSTLDSRLRAASARDIDEVLRICVESRGATRPQPPSNLAHSASLLSVDGLGSLQYCQA
ncbi:MAG: hypothetical protein MUQ27_05970 [Acidimicrobiia bacterium]|nr:hypothetical protein [Acidimicrobiia bacterium]